MQRRESGGQIKKATERTRIPKVAFVVAEVKNVDDLIFLADTPDEIFGQGWVIGDDSRVFAG